jgi:hypothetical protein
MKSFFWGGHARVVCFQEASVEDVGADVNDMECFYMETSHVVGVEHSQ